MWTGSLGLILKQLISVCVCVCHGIIVSGTVPKKPSGFAVWETENLPPSSTTLSPSLSRNSFLLYHTDSMPLAGKCTKSFEKEQSICGKFHF